MCTFIAIVRTHARKNARLPAGTPLHAEEEGVASNDIACDRTKGNDTFHHSRANILPISRA